MEGLDKYLTSEPYDGYGDWEEELIGNCISEKFYYDNEGWIFEIGGKFNEWSFTLFNREKLPSDAAKIIERAFTFYKL